MSFLNKEEMVGYGLRSSPCQSAAVEHIMIRNILFTS